MRDLVTIVVPRIAAEWNVVAYCMNFEIFEIKIIREKCRGDPEKCCIELLERWLQANSCRTWEMLLAMFKQVRNFTTITEIIENDLKRLKLYVNVVLQTILIYVILHLGI